MNRYLEAAESTALIGLALAGMLLSLILVVMFVTWVRGY